MARAIKDGLIFFSFDCDFFSNRKIKVLKANYGLEGISIYMYLLCEIYKNGYFLKIDKDYEYIISDDLNTATEKIKAILNFLIEHSLFDKRIFDNFGVLTSKGIQERFQLAIKERAKKTPRAVIGDYWILSESETALYINVPNFSKKNEDNSEKNDTKKRIEKKTKEKDSIENKSKENDNKEKESDKVVVVVDFYKQNINFDIKESEIEEIQSWLDKDFDESLIIECIKIAVLANKKSMKYISGILRNIEKKNIKTLEEYQEAEKNRKEKGEKNYRNGNIKNNIEDDKMYGICL